ncbi:hypothetical protein ACLOA0_06425 [Limosilactobacillus fermentum]|uniref:Transposase n=2 Tax=Limosilactobacillus fermentum TaxID=1613 RepID=A0ABD0APT8_LIMFE|nr:hypothetical protein [Limosilactobacillus fermentum]UVF13758.1 hypothetical protein NHG87_000640 [Limosilactobacillus fermentum]UVW02761.1 hypothetical protein NX839_06270 [Limosilactobacillus fermentum]WEN05228.1 hypothetical protein P0M30_09015 [Limosilactobacillus fermentum]WEN12082.1 hypothetical protein P0N62_09025 [Limosilactobacillus fermentum]WJD38736.1 hypothetical protein QRA02_09025 [Limosilactobacillus fermentum]
MAEMWQKQDVSVDATFLHHDHPQLSQYQIRADVDYWLNHRRHPLITLITKWPASASPGQKREVGNS